MDSMVGDVGWCRTSKKRRVAIGCCNWVPTRNTWDMRRSCQKFGKKDIKKRGGGIENQIKESL